MSVQIILVRIYFYNELSPFVCKFTSKTVSLLLYLASSSTVVAFEIKQNMYFRTVPTIRKT
jgi:hypothetical protein